ncbi:type III toxin-antitoxin system ToxN/AbiQ family toxin [Vibrio cholerae]|nr:type III toxin-antitoxin system ToxN/AbiQ family toxin [Vibrio cholerae]
MLFYTVSDEYVAFLKSIDSNVPDNYNEGRAYVGIVLNVNGIKYLAPLTSYKAEKQDRLSPSLPTLLKMYEKGNPKNPLGMVQINNMIPVLDSEITLLDLASQAEPYKSMLNKQLFFLKQTAISESLQAKAEKLYKYVVKDKHSFYSKISCKFDELENSMSSFQSSVSQPATAGKLDALVSMFGKNS